LSNVFFNKRTHSVTALKFYKADFRAVLKGINNMANTEANTKIADSAKAFFPASGQLAEQGQQRTKNQKFCSQTVWKISAYCLLVMAVFSSAINFQSTVVKSASSALAPSGIGHFDLWTANTGTKVDAVASNDGDSTFITSTSTTGDAQTFSFPGAAVPAGVVVNSVTLTALAKVDSSFGEIQLLAENGTSPVANKPGVDTVSNTASYAPVTWTMATNPITHAAWTAADVNSWAMNFGVANVSAFSGAKVTQIFLSVDYTVLPTSAPNPALASQTCGLDIALVLDNSDSINSSELATMKTAFKGFVNTLLPGTPTEFSVTKFGTTAAVLHIFSNSAATATGAIGSVTTGGGVTNWEDGLIKAQSISDPRPNSSHPNVIIFASDGVPNTYNTYDSHGNITGTQGTGGLTTDPLALNAAVTEANLIKGAGTRILTLGIGSGVVQANLEAISSSDAYYSVSDFSHLAPALDGIAGDMCGGTVTVTKKIDADGKLATTNDQTSGGAGFTFDISPGHTGQVTDANGQTSAVAVTAGSYSVAETNLPSGYTALGGSCSGSATNNGIASGTMVSGITVGANDIVACTFYNQSPSGSGGSGTSTPTSTDISILKTVDKATANPGDTVNFSLAVINNGPSAATGVVASDTLPSGLNFVSSTSTIGSYNDTTSLWNIGNLANGASATTTITATVASSTAGQILTNIATASSTSPDLNSVNNSSSASVTVNSSGSGNGDGGTSADLSMVKTVDNATPNPGDTIIYTLVISNLGPSPATGVTATDTLPSTVTFVSSTSTVGSYNATTSLWTVGNLINGASATTTITAMVNSGTAGQSIANSASVTAVTIDPVLSNNTSSAGSSVPSPSSSGGCLSNCGGGGGGGSYSSGGGSSSGGGVPQGQVSSTSTTASSLAMPVVAPQVLGATTQLPRTGLPPAFLFLVFATIAALADKKLKLV
jgi:uncharacterized repeat protein (TIGR01451 family)